jgi:hypothetical protein
MSHHNLLVTCYVCRRKRMSMVPGQPAETSYQVWLLAWPEADPGTPAGDDAAAVTALGQPLLMAVDGLDGTAAAWQSAELSGPQAADLATRLGPPAPDPGAAVADPGPATLLGPAAAAALDLTPVAPPLDRAVHRLEVIAVVSARADGQPGLTVRAARHLAYEEAGGALAGGLAHALGAPAAHSEATPAGTLAGGS